ncbi:MAG: lipoyl protein ligase domain-containing protein, partial [Bacteriovoracaceae bacterium]
CFSHIYQKQGKSLELKKVADFNSEVIRIFADASLVVQTSDRHDLKLKKNEEFYKFSGQAFKQTKNRVLHHGTLLWDADLEVLDRLCHFKDPEEISSKAIRSLKSIVLNLNSLDLFAETQSFSSYFFEKSSWKLEEINIRPIIKQYEEAIIQAYATYKSKDWVYDRNPKFSIKHSFKDDEVIYSFKGVELVAIKSSLGRNYSWSSGLLGLKLIQNDFQKFFHDLKESSNASAELNLVQGFLSYYVLRN